VSTVDEAVRVVALWRAAPGRAEPVREILARLAEATAAEPGCTRFEVLESSPRPGTFVLLETYADPVARREHLASAHFRELVLGCAVPLLEHRDVQSYQTLWSYRAPRQAPGTDGKDAPHGRP
jgi:quinol monooxygenase YgiN